MFWVYKHQAKYLQNSETLSILNSDSIQTHPCRLNLFKEAYCVNSFENDFSQPDSKNFHYSESNIP